MSTIAHHAATYLAAQLTGYTAGTNVFVDFMPDSPAACIAVYNAGGNLGPHGDECPVSEGRIEIRTRAATKAAALTLAETVMAKLHRKLSTTLATGVTALHCNAIDAPALIETDQKRRAVYLTRYAIEYRSAYAY